MCAMVRTKRVWQGSWLAALAATGARSRAADSKDAAQNLPVCACSPSGSNRASSCGPPDVDPGQTLALSSEQLSMLIDGVLSVDPEITEEAP